MLLENTFVLNLRALKINLINGGLIQGETIGANPSEGGSHLTRELTHTERCDIMEFLDKADGKGNCNGSFRRYSVGEAQITGVILRGGGREITLSYADYHSLGGNPWRLVYTESLTPVTTMSTFNPREP